MKRRDLVKSLASIPILGVFGYFSARAYRFQDRRKQKKLDFVNSLDIKAAVPPELPSPAGDILKIGIIGTGIRGPQLLQALGFMHATRRKNYEQNSPDRLQAFMSQEDLRVRVTAVCDLFDHLAQRAMETVTTEENKPVRYLNYQELIEQSGVDAVVIATADIWHAPIGIAALKAGKHVYIEKPMTHKLSELYALRKAARESGKVLQLGHQHRQTQSFLTARDVVRKNTIGHINLISTHTNRNTDNGSWQYNLYPEQPDSSIDWKQFVKGYYDDMPMSREIFFRWRKYWKFGSGLTGDLLSHEFDSINAIMNMGIPRYVTTSGGIYTHRDGREVPDVMHVAMEFPDYFMGSSQEAGKERGMTFHYSASLGNQFSRQTTLMGHDGTMRLGQTLELIPDPQSTRYKEEIKAGLLQPGKNMYVFDPRQNRVDAVTSATTQYFAEKGLLFDYRGEGR